MTNVSENVNVPYACGKLFAVYEQLQYKYVNGKKLNRNLAQSYFAGAMRTPGRVFPVLGEKSIVYLNGEALDKSRVYFSRLIGDMFELVEIPFHDKCFVIGVLNGILSCHSFEKQHTFDTVVNSFADIRSVVPYCTERVENHHVEQFGIRFTKFKCKIGFQCKTSLNQFLKAVFLIVISFG